VRRVVILPALRGIAFTASLGREGHGRLAFGDIIENDPVNLYLSSLFGDLQRSSTIVTGDEVWIQET
jgi:hypothetical protein